MGFIRLIVYIKWYYRRFENNMKNLSFLIITLLLSCNFTFSQDLTDFYSKGMQKFNQGNYSNAIVYFQKIVSNDEVEELILSSSSFYIGECLLGIEQIDGAISQFEKFIYNYPTSNFRELALFRLGNLYFEKKMYENSRKYLSVLVKAYPLSQYSGSAFHLIGESFIEEDNLDAAEEFFSSAVNSKRNNSFVDNSIYSLANLYERKGKYQEAVNYYDKLLGYYRNSDLATLSQLRIGVCYYYLGEYDNAVLELSDPLIKKLDIDGQNEADFILANSFYRLKEYDNAINAYKRILKNSPSSQMLDRIRYGIAWIHFQKRDYSDSFKIFSLLAQAQDDSLAAKSLYWSGESKRYSGNYDEAIEIYKQFVKKYPQHPYSEKIKLNIGISKFTQNSFSESEEALLESLNSGDAITKIKSLTLLGEISLRKRNYKASAEYFNRGLLIPKIPKELKDRCNLGLGVSNFYRKNNVEANKNLNAINEKETSIDLDKLNFYKGEVNFALGNYLKAAKYYDKVKTNDEILNRNTIYGKAYSYFNLKDFSKAAHFFNKYLKINDDEDKLAECNLRLADCYYGTKLFGKASRFYEKALLRSEKFSNDDRSYFNYSQALFKDGNVSKAISSLENFQARFPYSQFADRAQYLIAWIYFQNNQFDEAINSCNQLFSNYPNSTLLPMAYYSIGDSYFNKGEYSKAIASYNRLIAKYPKSSTVYDAINGIQYCYIVQDKQKEAIKYLNNFISANNDAEFIDKVQFKKAEIFYSAGDYKSAVTEYDRLIDNYSNSLLVPDAYYWKGKSLTLSKNDDDAKISFREVINRSLNSEVGFNSVLELGKLFRKYLNFEQEIELYDEVIPKISDKKKLSEIKFAKSQNYIESKNIAAAYKSLNEIVSQHDGSLFNHKAEIELGILELSRNGYENALFLFRDVVNNREDDIAAQAQYYIGLSFFEQEKMPEAITELIKMRSLYSAYDEWYTKGLILLGDSYVKINDKVKAAEMYKAVLNRHRNDAIAKEVKEKLNKI